jgi:MGT family glycosyltransferase
MSIQRFFQPMEETFDERFVFVGPSILPRHQETPFPFEQLRDDLPLLYISMGSIAHNHIGFYKQCFAAFGGRPWQVVLTVGKATDTTQLGPIPDNFLLSPYVPQLDILPRARVFVTHGGMNSVMESMYYGVPMVVIPQQPEQQMNGKRIVDLGLGALLDTNTVNDVNLHAAVEQIVQNVEYRERAQAMRQATRDDGGYQRAVDAIIQFTQHQKSKV